MTQDHVSPVFEKEAFHCPWCGVYARQSFFGAMRTMASGMFAGAMAELSGFHVSSCDHCEHISIWHDEQLVYPVGSSAPEPHGEMPTDVREDYLEARSIADLSPRSAAGILRLALQKLTIHLGEPGKRLDDDIAALVRRGLDSRVQRAMDVLRISGNNALHPGELDLRDDRETVGKLFRLLNVIVQQMIAQTRELEELWEKMPEGAREATIRRDTKK